MTFTLGRVAYWARAGARKRSAEVRVVKVCILTRVKLAGLNGIQIVQLVALKMAAKVRFELMN